MNLLKTAGTRLIALVSITALIASSSGNTRNVSMPRPSTWPSSPIITSSSSAQLHRRILRKNTMRPARISVPTSGTANTKNSVQIQAMRPSCVTRVYPLRSGSVPVGSQYVVLVVPRTLATISTKLSFETTPVNSVTTNTNR